MPVENPGGGAGGGEAGPVSYDDLTDVPSTFPPSAHEHDHVANLAWESKVPDDSITTYPVGTSVVAFGWGENTADWPSNTSWEFTVQTTHYIDEDDDSHHGTQVLHQTENNEFWTRGSYYDEWSDWAKLATTVGDLGTNAKSPAAGPSSYPVGVSAFWATNDQTSGGGTWPTYADPSDASYGVTTIRPLTQSATKQYAHLVVGTGDSVTYERWWRWQDNAWSDWAQLLGAVAGTPSEGDVITYASGVPTWAAP